LEDLTDRQKSIFLYIKEEIAAKGYPPSVREIGEAVGLKSPASVHSHLKTLENKGYLRRDPEKPRAIEVLKFKDSEISSAPGNENNSREIIEVPILGRVTAGVPILSEENIEDFFPLPLDYFNPGNRDIFMLEVKGNSMINAGINSGDYVVAVQQEVAENGDIVIALLENETTVKRYFEGHNQIRLEPENPSYDVITGQDISILGKVIGLFRHIN